jgi:hypothetical protein
MSEADTALGRLSGLYMGFGNFGLNLGVTIAKIVCRDFKLNPERFVKHIRVYDFYPDVVFSEKLKRMGLKGPKDIAEGETIDAEAVRCSNYLSYGLIASAEELPYNIAAGVGSYWPLSAHHARKNFQRIYSELVNDLEQKAGRRITDFNVFIYAASSGGGTGNGSAPELASQLISKLEKEEKLAAPHVLHIGATVLPFETDPRIGLAEPNTLTFFGRFSKVVKTILVGDNHYVQITRRFNQEEAERELNETLAWAILGLFFMNYVQTGRYEVADYVAFFSAEERSTWVVPAFTFFREEEFIGLLEKWEPEVPVEAIVLQLKNSLTAEINTAYEARKLLVILVLPRAVSVSWEFYQALRNALSREFNVRENRIHIAFAYANVRGLALAFAYVVDPFIQRIAKIYSKNASIFEASSSRKKFFLNLAAMMKATMPISIESYEEELLSRDVEYIEKALNQFHSVFEYYLGNWGLTPEKVKKDPNTTNFFLDLLPKLKEPAIEPRQMHRFKLEVIRLEGGEQVSLIDLAVILNSSRNLSFKNYHLLESLDRTLRETIEAAHAALDARGQPWVCLKIGGTYIPLTEDFLNYSVSELVSVSNLTISLVYFGEQKMRESK